MILCHPCNLACHEHVYKLVPDHVPEMIIGTIVRNDDSSFYEFKEPTDSLRYESRRRVGLLEMKMGAVENERDSCGNRVIEFLFENLETFFGEISALFGKVIHPRIEMDVEMFSPKDLPVKFGVLNLVSSEVVELGRRGRSENGGEETISQEGFHRRGTGLGLPEDSRVERIVAGLFKIVRPVLQPINSLSDLGQFVFQMIDDVDRCWILFVENRQVITYPITEVNERKHACK